MIYSTQCFRTFTAVIFVGVRKPEKSILIQVLTATNIIAVSIFYESDYFLLFTVITCYDINLRALYHSMSVTETESRVGSFGSFMRRAEVVESKGHDGSIDARSIGVMCLSGMAASLPCVPFVEIKKYNDRLKAPYSCFFNTL